MEIGLTKDLFTKIAQEGSRYAADHEKIAQEGSRYAADHEKIAQEGSRYAADHTKIRSKMTKIKILCLMPIACLAANVQVPGEWTLLSDAVVTQVEHPAVPRVFSGQQSTLITTKVHAQDGVKTAELKSMPGVRIEEGAVSLVYSASKEVNEFARMVRPPANGSVWYESTFWTGGESWARVGKTWMHPGNKSDTARVFVAPKAGRLSVSGVVKKLHLEGDGVKVSVRHNSKVVWSADLGGKDGLGKEAACAVDVKKGDTLRFIVNRGGSYSGVGPGCDLRRRRCLPGIRGVFG